jgi:catechol 2,3-dioxygenase-like lactoylglutathione lyase family enzyme
VGLAGPISDVDVVGIPSTDTARSREFYVETLGLKPDERSWNEFWVGGTCFAIWEPGSTPVSATWLRSRIQTGTS